MLHLVAVNRESPLKDKVILVVDDEPDVLETVREDLEMCVIDEATDCDTDSQYIRMYASCILGLFYMHR